MTFIIYQPKYVLVSKTKNDMNPFSFFNEELKPQREI